MLNPMKLYDQLEPTIGAAAARTVASAIGQAYEDLTSAVTKSEFFELTATVDRIADAQERSVARLERLEATVERLAEAQERAETRLDRLEATVERLAEAQERAETRLDRLEATVERLAEAQERTETTVQGLAKQVGGLSASVGYGLENEAMRHIRDFAQRVFGMRLSLVDRRNIRYPGGRYDEINIYGEGEVGGTPSILIAEAKAQPSKGDVERFQRLLDRLKNHTDKPLYPVFIGHSFAPEVEDYLAEEFPHIRAVGSYELVAQPMNNASGASS
jgi:hypothetical protein